MDKIPINLEDTTIYLCKKEWEMENEWRRHQEKVLQKNMVEFFNKLHNEAYNCRKLRTKSGT